MYTFPNTKWGTGVIQFFVFIIDRTQKKNHNKNMGVQISSYQILINNYILRYM